MRAMPIRVLANSGGIVQLKASFTKNWIHYLQEALGLAIFMISACFFGSLLESDKGLLRLAIENSFERMLTMGVLMGSTALFIFYSPWTSPSGSHINPAVTLSFLRLGKICHWDAAFYIVFQFAGGTAAVFAMQYLVGDALINPPVSSAVTVPGKAGIWPAFFMEFVIAFITMSIVLLTSEHNNLKKYTRMLSGCLVCVYVVIAGPISGFGMNPARSFASAWPAHNWTAAWIYLAVPVVSMLCAAECFLLLQKMKNKKLPDYTSHKI